MFMAEITDKPEFIDINLLRFKFRFRRMFWREEMILLRDRKKDKDPVRQLLSHALHSVSGLTPSSLEEAEKVISAIPEAIVVRVWRVYRGSLPPNRMFTTSNLFQAPEPSVHQHHLAEEEVIEENLHDRTIQEMESKY